MSGDLMPPTGPIDENDEFVSSNLSRYMLPCPFCGDQGHMNVQDQVADARRWQVECVNPRCAVRPRTDKWVMQSNALYAWRDRDFVNG